MECVVSNLNPYLVDEDDVGRLAVLRALRRQDAHRPTISGGGTNKRDKTHLHTHLCKSRAFIPTYPAPQIATVSPSDTSPISFACQAVDSTSESRSTSRSGSFSLGGSLSRLSSAAVVDVRLG